MNLIHLLSSQAWMDQLGWTLVHFLWQGLVIAIVYAFARRVLRSPQARYLLGCAALVAMMAAPVATLLSSGPGDPVPTIASPVSSRSTAIDVSASVTQLPIVESAGSIMPWLVMAWLAGAIVLSLRLASGWVYAARVKSVFVRPAPENWQHTLSRLSARLRVSRPVTLLVSAVVQVPSAVGWLRPAILMPAGALTGLPPEHIEAILAHELAHIRRHDYLVNIVQGIAESLLFYHPAVWWISAHVRNERELCCDDMAVSISGDPILYAQALAGLESCRPAHLNFVLAANGGLLVDRIARLVGRPRAERYPLAGAASAVTVTLLVATACLLSAQPSAPRAFEVASVKLNNSAASSSDTGWSPEAGTLNFVNATLRNAVQIAYDVKPAQLETPSWMESERFDINAKAAGPVSDSQIRQMLQTLLAQRFGLVMHREKRSISVYRMTVGQNGLKLKKSEPGARIWNDSGRGHLDAHGMAMNDFVDFLAENLDRPVVDATGLKGGFEISLDWAVEGTPASADPGASLFTVVQDKLGLRLAAGKGDAEFVVVDRANRRPTEN